MSRWKIQFPLLYLLCAEGGGKSRADWLSKRIWLSRVVWSSWDSFWWFFGNHPFTRIITPTYRVVAEEIGGKKNERKVREEQRRKDATRNKSQAKAKGWGTPSDSRNNPCMAFELCGANTFRLVIVVSNWWDESTTHVKVSPDFYGLGSCQRDVLIGKLGTWPGGTWTDLEPSSTSTGVWAKWILLDVVAMDTTVMW